MPEVKKIPTFSWLVRKADQFYRKNRDEYLKLRTSGSDKFLRGCIVQLWCPEHGGTFAFHIKSPAGGMQTYATIDSRFEKGEFYTRYMIHATATRYRKRMHKWLPISLPDGIKAGVTTPAVYFNADGTVAKQGHWYGARRGRSGDPSEQFLVIRDSDGKFIPWGRDPSGQDHVGFRFHPQEPTDLHHGFIPGTVESKLEWYKSMVPPEFANHDFVKDGKAFVAKPVDKPLWNADRVKLLAAKVHSEALRLTKAYPHIKIAMFPGCLFLTDSKYFAEDFRMSRFGGNRSTVVVGFSEHGHPLLWNLPELVIYWVADKKDTQYKASDEARYIRVVFPPVGCPQLERRNNESYMTTTYRWGLKNSLRELQRYTSSHAIERAYHQLKCLKIGAKADGTLWSQSRRPSVGSKYPDHPCDGLLHNWDESQSVVMVWEFSQMDNGYRSIEPLAAKPEGIFSQIEERELIDCLPLC